MKSLLLIGGGGHCHSCIDVIEAEVIFEVAGIVIPSEENKESVFGHDVLGNDGD